MERREARKRKIAMSAEERLAKITGLYKKSEEEKETTKIQFSSEDSDPRVQEIESNYEKVEYIAKEESISKEISKEFSQEISKEFSQEIIPLRSKKIYFSNEFSTRLFAIFILAFYYSLKENSENVEVISTIFISIQVLGSVQEFYSNQKFIYNDYLKMVGLGNDQIDLILRIYQGICGDIYMFIFVLGLGQYLRGVI